MGGVMSGMSGAYRLCPNATRSCTTVNAVDGAEPHCSPFSTAVHMGGPGCTRADTCLQPTNNNTVCSYQFNS